MNFDSHHSTEENFTKIHALFDAIRRMEQQRGVVSPSRQLEALMPLVDEAERSLNTVEHVHSLLKGRIV